MVPWPHGSVLGMEREPILSGVDMASELQKRSVIDETFKLAYRSYAQAQRSYVSDDSASAVSMRQPHRNIGVSLY